MFEALSTRLGEVFRRLRDRGKISPRDVDAVLGEVRTALAEADVPLEVLDPFVARVREGALDKAVLESLSPGQQVLALVHRELVGLLGPPADRFHLAGPSPRTILLVGPQGSGKTTTAGKLAHWCKAQGMHPLLVGTDARRPAAFEQLQRLSEQVGCKSAGGGADPVEALREGLRFAQSEGLDPVIVDTAGRFQTQEQLMQEIGALRRLSEAKEVLLVVDGFLGQEGLRMARSFDAAVGLTGAIVTKMEGDARGGVLLAFRAALQKPVRFLGVGEGLEALESLQSDRLASRMLGMGDLTTLVEEVQKAQAKLALPVRPPSAKAFGMMEFLAQLQSVRSMGPLDRVLGMMPGMGRRLPTIDPRSAEQELKHSEAIILSMTHRERRHPDILDGSRRRRIARGSGTRVEDVNRLVKQFLETRRWLKQVGRGGRGLGSLRSQVQRGR